MRTTLEIDDDVLQAAEELARRERTSLGRVISRLARKGLQVGVMPSPTGGFEVLAANGRVVTPELVQRLLEDDD